VSYKKDYKIHFINARSGKIYLTPLTSQVPRKDDEIRLGKKLFFRVTKVVWVFDEPESPYSRVNIGLEKIKI
jgi:hypothetical protein